MEKEPFFQSFQFNCSLIVAFFIAFVAVTCAILPALAIHGLGVRASDELSKYADPPIHRRNPTERPSSPNPVHGIPVAMTRAGETP
jgi:hypothetical protein